MTDRAQNGSVGSGGPAKCALYDGDTGVDGV